MAEPSIPENSAYSTPEPENSSSPEPEATDIAAEPIPDWTEATAIWKWGWEVHWVGFGLLFLFLALYAAWSIWCASREKKRRCRTMLVFISSLLFVFGLSRAFFLFLNPYESPQCYIIPKCDPLVARLLFAAGLPCMTAAFSFIQLMFLQVIKLKLYPGKVQNWKFLLTIVAIHFLLAYLIEVLVYFYADWRSLALICQSFYIGFSICLSASFVFSGQRIIKKVNRSALRVSRLGARTVRTPEKSMRQPQRKAKPYSPNITKLVKVTYMTAALGLLGCALELYAIFGMYNMYQSANIPKPKPIPWLIYQSLFRLMEILAGVTMAYVSPRQTKEWSYSIFPFLPCHRGGPYGPDSFEHTSLSSGKAVTLDMQNMKEELNSNAHKKM